MLSFLNLLNASGLIYEEEKKCLFEPVMFPHCNYKENIECCPDKICGYQITENFFDINDAVGNFFRNITVDGIEKGLKQNFDTQCDLLLHEFFKTKLYSKAKESIDQFIAAMLTDYHLASNKANLAAIDQNTDYHWQYLHDANNNIIGVGGLLKKVNNLNIQTKSTNKEEKFKVTVEESFSLPLMKIIGKRMCGLKGVKLGQYVLISNTQESNNLIPAACALDLDLLIEELPSFHCLITFVNKKSPQKFIAYKVDVILGEKNSLLDGAFQEKSFIVAETSNYFMAEKSLDKTPEPKRFLTKGDLDVTQTEVPPHITYSLLHSPEQDCILTSYGMRNIEHNPSITLDQIKEKLDCFSQSL
jgi:hypothetical protein